MRTRIALSSKYLTGPPPEGKGHFMAGLEKFVDLIEIVRELNRTKERAPIGDGRRPFLDLLGEIELGVGWQFFDIV
jgi:hypothetical protein